MKKTHHQPTMLKNQEVEEIVERLFKIKGAFHLTFWAMPGFSIWLVDIKKSEILCSVEAPEKLQETIFFCEILGL